MLRKLLRKKAPKRQPGKLIDPNSGTAALATCLGFVLEHPVSAAGIRKHLKGKHGGSITHSDLIRAARHYAKRARTITSIEELKKTLLHAPLLIHWFDPELFSEHYTVAYTIQGSMVFLLDPYWGKRRVEKTVFVRNWKTGKEGKPWALHITN